jgi:3alpha(or 20beta)-hydroxysteroid dehydrogenase
MKPFEDRTVLITGGARGQGAEGARRWVEGGGQVVIADVADEDGRRLAGSLGAAATYVHLDVGNETDWINAMELVGGRGALHGLVNNAGIFDPQPMEQTTLESFERHARVNQVGCFLGMRYAAEAMGRGAGGSIVNIGSSAGLRATPGAFAYSATKWALRGMTKAAALGLARKGIRVNAIFPGPIDTDMVKFWTPEQTERRVAKVPMRRLGTAAEVAAMVVFLLSDESNYMTGAEITVDGGASL